MGLPDNQDQDNMLKTPLASVENGHMDPIVAEEHLLIKEEEVELIKEIGRGGASTAYLGMDHRPGRKKHPLVCVKVLRDSDTKARASSYPPFLCLTVKIELFARTKCVVDILKDTIRFAVTWLLLQLSRQRRLCFSVRRER